MELFTYASMTRVTVKNRNGIVHSCRKWIITFWYKIWKVDEKWYLRMLYLQVLYAIGNQILQLLTVQYKCKYVDETSR